MILPKLIREDSAGRYSDVMLASLVVGIVAMMILPLPTFLLDLLITLNISIAVVLLLVSIYLGDAPSFTVFPSLLLLTTLFRLGLNVSSTRLILLQADAGQVIASFGSFVVGSNLVVGAVIFLILTVIQFIVIAKGSERVAEVAARFSLDAMPGRQMSIDADVRAGTLDQEQARRQRANLQRESQLYGSMDGAMRFVKGDAVAAILITSVNIIGGLLVGVLQQGLSVGQAAKVYSVLTIGDGLVSQIPALLIATAAGIVVTRVSSEDAASHLGEDIGRQVLAHPRAIALAAGLLALLALLPGLPATPFLLLAVALGVLAHALVRARRRVLPEAAGSLLQSPSPVAEPESPVVLEVGAALARCAQVDHLQGRLTRELIRALGELMMRERGLPLPSGVLVRPNQARLTSHQYRVLLFGVPEAVGEVRDDVLLAAATTQRVRELGLSPGEEIFLPGLARPITLVPADGAATALRKAKIAVVDAPTQMVLHLGQVLRDHAPRLLGLQEVRNLLDRLQQSHPALVQETVPKVVSLQVLTEVLQDLAAEDISIGDLRQILQALARWGAVEKTPEELAARARHALRRAICHSFTGPESTLRAHVLDHTIEETIQESIRRSQHGADLALEPDLRADIIRAVKRSIHLLPNGPPGVILTRSNIRRPLGRLLQHDLPGLAVLSHDELIPGLKVQHLGRIGLDS